MFYVYAHKNPINNQIFYIGKGTKRRGYQTDGRSREWQEIVTQIKQQDLMFSVLILKTFNMASEAFKFEDNLIKKYKSQGALIVNNRVLVPHGAVLLYGETKYNKNSPLIAFLKEKRKELNVTQQEFAKIVKLGLGAVRKIEQGDTSIELRNVLKALNHFGYEVGPVARL